MRVLIVDDSKMYRKALQQELSVSGYELEQEADPRAALERVKSEHFDLITLDVDMPELDGIELCKLIRGESESHLKELPIVFVTGTDTIEGRIKCFESGASHFVPKAFPKGELLSVVKGLLEPETRFRHHTILIADDSGIVRKSLDQTLRRYEVTLLFAEDGKEALDKIIEHRDEISMLITDYQMPEINGEELCIKVRRQLGLKDMPIILLSADGSRERKLEIFKAGATDYVEKPFLAEELRARVEAQLVQVDSLRRIRSLNTQLSTSNQSLNSFVSMASHDLRTPIGNSSTILEAMMEDWKETSDEEKMEFLEMAKDSSSRALSILEGLLKYSTSSSKALEVSDISASELFTNVVSDLKFKIDEKQASVEWDELPSFQGDQTLIHQVFLNLIGNALKYQPKSNIPNVYVHLLEEEDDSFTCMVEDNGIGFTEEDGKKLFEPFTRVGNPTAYEGTGIGLSTVSNIVERHGGRIWATSEPGVGSRFFIELPKRLEAE